MVRVVRLDPADRVLNRHLMASLPVIGIGKGLCVHVCGVLLRSPLRVEGDLT